MAKKKVEKVEVETTEVQNVEAVQEKPFVPLTFEEIKEKITVKSKCDVVAKQGFLRLVEDNCVVKDEINGIFYIDEIMEMVSVHFGRLSYYTDFYTVIENAGQYTYDYLYECGLFEYIASNIDKSDYDVIQESIYNLYSKVKDLNGVGACLYRIVDKAMKNLPDVKDINKLIKGLPKAINGIDKDVLGMFAKELGNGTTHKQTFSKDEIIDIITNNKKK